MLLAPARWRSGLPLKTYGAQVSHLRQRITQATMLHLKNLGLGNRTSSVSQYMQRNGVINMVKTEWCCGMDQKVENGGRWSSLAFSRSFVDLLSTRQSARHSKGIKMSDSPQLWKLVTQWAGVAIQVLAVVSKGFESRIRTSIILTLQFHSNKCKLGTLKNS